MKKKNKTISLAISWGDPAGIGPEVMLKAFGLLPKTVRNKMTLFGDPGYMRNLDKSLKTGVPVLDANNASKTADGLRVKPIGQVDFLKRDFGKIDKRFGDAAMRALDMAAKAVLEGEYNALVTAPIQKESVNLAGYKIAGHTERLAKMCGGADVAMMLANRRLKVVVATTHLALRDVPGALNKDKIERSIRIIDTSFKRMTGKRPKIAVCGLNPHAGDGGLFGDEEERIITPAILATKKDGVRVTGPHPADSLFTQQSIKQFDVALAMYHDQGLAPVKLLGFHETVNITLGLPFVRTSAGHGAALDIAGKKKANGENMACAIMAARDILAGKYK
ncbi:4-hydroxythreonine-4-phosphate dehydrogenase [hydrothermal vent metagenome]|uniref:4-hydroxythreonine-4-phosphate dehydrogenase n=1 Tax=hydrothermal vent metagenome TaxID=652676 RepID=A0A3B1C5A3_9ZZZZ